MISTLNQLEKLSQKQLDALFSKGTAKQFPSGDTDGVVLLQPFFTKKFGETVWKGKSFNLQKMELTNRMLGLHLIKGKLRKEKSLFDNKPALIIDYTKTSLVAGNIIDELREISKGIYLGRAYRQGKYFASFALRKK